MRSLYQTFYMHYTSSELKNFTYRKRQIQSIKKMLILFITMKPARNLLEGILRFCMLNGKYVLRVYNK